jgi:hypothetical protein
MSRSAPRPANPATARQSYRRSGLRASASSRGSRTRDAGDGTASLRVRCGSHACVQAARKHAARCPFCHLATLACATGPCAPVRT